MNDVDGQAFKNSREGKPDSRTRRSPALLPGLVRYRWRISVLVILIGAGAGIAGYVLHIGLLVCLWAFLLLFLVSVSLLALLIPGRILGKYECFTQNGVVKNPNGEKDLATLFGAVLGVVVVVATCVTLVAMAYATVGDLRTNLTTCITEKTSQVTTDVCEGQDKLEDEIVAGQKTKSDDTESKIYEVRERLEAIAGDIMDTFEGQRDFLIFFANTQHIFGIPLGKIYKAWGD